MPVIPDDGQQGSAGPERPDEVATPVTRGRQGPPRTSTRLGSLVPCRAGVPGSLAQIVPTVHPTWAFATAATAPVIRTPRQAQLRPHGDRQRNRFRANAPTSATNTRKTTTLHRRGRTTRRCLDRTLPVAPSIEPAADLSGIIDRPVVSRFRVPLGRSGSARHTRNARQRPVRSRGSGCRRTSHEP